jgi:predicted NBD/HSP70 family sugar kinase
MSRENMVSETIRKSILHHIMRNGSFITSEISDDTGYSTTTVGKYITQLIENGFLAEIDKVNLHNKGRRTVRYGIGSEQRYFIGVDISAFEMAIGIMDISGKMIRLERNTQFRQNNSHDTLEQIFDSVRNIIETTEGIEKSMILGINLNLPGRVNSSKGTSATIFNFEDTANTPLVEILSDRMGIPVYIENDTKAMTYGEYMSGLSNSYNNLCYINIGWGLGLGLIIDGKLYYGKDGYSGEFGHVNLYDNNVLCHCGKKGCLETEVSGRAIVRKLTERILAGETSVLSGKVKSGGVITMSDIIMAIKNEDALCIELISAAGTELGHQLAGLVNILNPDIIMIGGSLSKIESYYFLQYTKLAIRQYSLKLMNQDVPVVSSSLGDDAAVIGACLIARNKTMLGKIG